jgi:hypothetical protein
MLRTFSSLPEIVRRFLAYIAVGCCFGAAGGVLALVRGGHQAGAGDWMFVSGMLVLGSTASYFIWSRLSHPGILIRITIQRSVLIHMLSTEGDRTARVTGRRVSQQRPQPFRLPPADVGVAH